MDIAPSDPGADPVREAQGIVKELQKYDEALYRKPRWLVLNKIDLLPEEARESATKRFRKDFGWKGPTFAISALTGAGCRELVFAVMDHLEEASGAAARVSAKPVARRRKTAR